MTDIIVIAIVLLLVGGAAAYIIRTKKSGAKCIGCPENRNCAGKCNTCSGCGTHSAGKD